MTEQLSRRVAALEQASSKAPALRIIVANFGETAQEALKRVGVVPGSGQRVLVVVFG